MTKPTKKIIAIGGGEIGRPGHATETTEIDKEIIRLTEKKNPKVLFLPTASGDSQLYCFTVFDHFGTRLGCECDYLLLSRRKYSQVELEDKILSSDIIYVGGGNTQKMLKTWKKTGLDKILKKAYEKGIVLSGLSAGAICWFAHGNSDSKKMINPEAPLIKISGLGYVKALFCPHYDHEEYRKPELKEMMKKTSGVAIAIDNCAAIEIIDDKYRIISSKSEANAYKVYWSKGKFYHETIPKRKEYSSIDNLIKR